MSRLAIVILVSCGAGAAGCQSASPPESTNTVIENGSVTPVLHEFHTGFGDPARFVVRDPRLWAEVWRRAYVGTSEVPQRPAIDFGREMVVVAAQGGQPSSGYDIAIERVAAEDSGITVDVTTTSPDLSCVVLTVITAPVVMVRIPRSDSRVRFIEHARSATCE